MWKYSSENDYQNISLHDCRVQKIYINNDDLVLSSDDYGFWIAKGNSQNPYGQTLRTDNAEIHFKNYCKDSFTFFILKDIRLFGKLMFTQLKYIPLSNLTQRVYSGVWKFEVIDEYYGYHEAVYHGYIYQSRKPYAFQMKISYDKIIYFWNKILEDRY